MMTPLNSLSGEIAEKLTTAIAVGEYLPGARLPPERELARTLSVGRDTLRAAIRELVGIGLLRSQQGRGGGTFVVEVTSETAFLAIERALTRTWDLLMDRLEAEAWMHGTIAEAAAMHRTSEDVERIERLLEAFRVAGAGEQAREADAQFHLAITEATHNESLARMLLSLERSMHLNAPAHPWGVGDSWEAFLQRSRADHEVLAESIRLQDADRARVTGRQHAGINREIVVAALENARAELYRLRHEGEGAALQ